VHSPSCQSVVVDLQRRVLRSVNLSPRIIEKGAGKLVYLSRQDTGWRRLVNEEALVEEWNKLHVHSGGGSKGGGGGGGGGGEEEGEGGGEGGDLEMLRVHLHEMPIREQLLLLQDTRVMIGVNGGQINALFFLPQGSTHAAIFAMRWTDQNFGYVYHSWLKHRGVRYLQYDCTRGGTTNFHWLGQVWT
jgi:capsular polysaccharide biosynthesis protein